MAGSGFGKDFYNIVLEKSGQSISDFSNFLQQNVPTPQSNPDATTFPVPYTQEPVQSPRVDYGAFDPNDNSISRFIGKALSGNSQNGFIPRTAFNWAPPAGVPTPNTKVEPNQGGQSQHGTSTARPTVTVPQGSNMNTGQMADGTGFTTEYGRDLAPAQFGDPQLSFADAVAACGPVAAIAFLRETGRNMTLSEAVNIARDSGTWDQSTGMHGPEAEQRLLAQMGINATLAYAPVKQDAINAVESGRAVILSSPGDYHYYVITDYNPQTGEFYVGNTGNVWADPKRNTSWKTWESIGPQAALYFDPGAASDLMAATNGTDRASPGQPAGQSPQQAQYTRNTIVESAREYGGDEFSRVVNGVLSLEGGLDGSVGDNGNSYGPFQFHRQGQLGGFAQYMGVSEDDAAVIARRDPQAVAQYAFSYLYPVYQEAKQMGLTGPDLLNYVQVNGQRSQPPSPDRLLAAWG